MRWGESVTGYPPARPCFPGTIIVYETTSPPGVSIKVSKVLGSTTARFFNNRGEKLGTQEAVSARKVNLLPWGTINNAKKWLRVSGVNFLLVF